MLGYILFTLAMIVMIACLGGAIVYMTDGGSNMVDMEMNENGEFEAVALVK